MTDTLRFQAKAKVDLAPDGPTGPRLTIAPAYGGGIMRVSGQGSVLVDLGGLEGIGDAVQLCRDHSAEVDDLLGEVTAATDGRTLSATGRLNDSPAGQRVVRLFKSGQRIGASIGAEIVDAEPVEAGKTIFANGRQHTAPAGGVLHVKRAVLREISIVGVGADKETKVSIEARLAAANEGDKAMDEKQTIAAALERIDQHEDILDASTLKTIRASYLGGQIDDAGLADELHEATLRTAKRDKMLASRPSAVMNYQRADGGAEVSNRNVLASATLARYGLSDVAERHFGEHAAQRGVDLRATSSLDLCAKALQLSHRDVPTDRGELIRAAFSTSDMGSAATAASEAILVDSYKDTPQNWREVATIRATPDFREHSLTRPYQKNGEFVEVGRGGEIEHSSPSAASIPYAVRTWARMFSLSRQDIVDDQIGAVLELMREFGRNAARTMSSKFWTMLKTADSEFLIDDTNYFDGADTALDIDSLEDAIIAMRSMTGEDGEPIDLTLGSLIVPPALEATSRQLLNSMELARDSATTDGLPTANPWKDSMNLIVEPRLGASATGGSDTAWYVAASPSSVPALIVSFLNGRQVPTVETDETAFNTLGQQFRAYIDAGFNLGDYRGIIGMKGTA